MPDEQRYGLDGDGLVQRTIMDTRSLPLCPPVKAAEEAVHAILKADFRVSVAAARRRVRVEITRELEMELRSLVSVNNLYLIHDPTKEDGPIEIMGVSYYVVRRLPEPGWRVIS